MKGLKSVLFAGLIAFSSHAIADGLKIGVVDYRTIVATSPKAKAIGDSLKQEFKSREDAIVSTEKSLVEKNEKLQRNGSIMSEAEKTKLEREVMAGQRELQRLQYEFREDTSLRQREEMQKLMEQVQVVVEKIAKEQKYDIVFHREVMPYMAKNIDMTDNVLKAMANG
jgi:outer membrane protein